MSIQVNSALWHINITIIVIKDWNSKTCSYTVLIFFSGCINNSETVDENGFSKSQLDNLYSYYSQFEDTPDPIECIIETYKRNQNQTKTRLNVIQVWLFFKKLLEKLAFCYQNWSDLLWEKNALVIEKNFWNSRLKAENLQNFWDH